MKYKEKDGGYSSLGEFLVAVRKACMGEIKDSRLIPAVKTAGHLCESEDAQGGYLVPEFWADGIYHLALEGAIVRPRATVLKAASDSLKVRTLVDSNRSSSIFGGITFTWTEERGAKTSAITKPALGQLELTPHKLVGGLWASNELENDYGQFGQFMQIAFGQAIRFIEDESFIYSGTGAGQPMSIMNSGLMISIARGAPNAVNWTDFAHLTERLLPDSWNRAVWLINPDAMDELLEATASAANQATVFDASRMTILNRPIIVTEKCAALGTTGDVILADFQHYIIADRSMEISASRHANFGGGNYGFITDETFWRVVLRVDGQPVVNNPITPYRGANTVSPFVCLTTSS